MKVHQLKALIKQCIYEVMQEQFSGGAPSPAFESRNMQRRPQEPAQPQRAVAQRPPPTPVLPALQDVDDPVLKSLFQETALEMAKNPESMSESPEVAPVPFNPKWATLIEGAPVRQDSGLFKNDTTFATIPPKHVLSQQHQQRTAPSSNSIEESKREIGTFKEFLASGGLNE